MRRPISDVTSLRKHFKWFSSQEGENFWQAKCQGHFCISHWCTINEFLSRKLCFGEVVHCCRKNTDYSSNKEISDKFCLRSFTCSVVYINFGNSLSLFLILISKCKVMIWLYKSKFWNWEDTSSTVKLLMTDLSKTMRIY